MWGGGGAGQSQPPPWTLSLPPSGNHPNHHLGKPVSLPPSPDCRLTNMPQWQDDGVEMTLSNQAPDSCPKERQKRWRKRCFSASLQRGVPCPPPAHTSSPAPALVPAPVPLLPQATHSAAPYTMVQQSPRGPAALTPLEAQELGAHVHFS